MKSQKIKCYFVVILEKSQFLLSPKHKAFKSKLKAYTHNLRTEESELLLVLVFPARGTQSPAASNNVRHGWRAMSTNLKSPIFLELGKTKSK